MGATGDKGLEGLGVVEVGVVVGHASVGGAEGVEGRVSERWSGCGSGVRAVVGAGHASVEVVEGRGKWSRRGRVGAGVEGVRAMIEVTGEV